MSDKATRECPRTHGALPFSVCWVKPAHFACQTGPQLRRSTLCPLPNQPPIRLVGHRRPCWLQRGLTDIPTNQVHLPNSIHKADAHCPTSYGPFEQVKSLPGVRTSLPPSPPHPPPVRKGLSDFCVANKTSWAMRALGKCGRESTTQTAVSGASHRYMT